MQEVNLIGIISAGGSLPVLDTLNVNENGTYTPPSGVDGYNEVNVAVPTPQPILETLNITENGTYTPPSGVDGYNEVKVAVPAPQPSLDTLNVTENGTYTPPSGVDGYNEVNVAVPTPQPILETLNVTENGTYTPPSGVDGYSPIVVNVPVYTPINGLYYKSYIENQMRITNGLCGDVKSEWLGNSSIGCTINGTVDLRNYHYLKLKGNITDSYEYNFKTRYDRCQFVCGFTDQIFNSVILVNYNTGDHIIDMLNRILTNEQSTGDFIMEFNIDQITGDHLYFFVSLLGIAGTFSFEVR